MIFDTVPKEFKPAFEVATCLIQFKGKYLFVERSDEEEYPRTWSLPGGKIENNETLMNAIKREIFEETGIKGEAIIYLKKYFVKYPDVDFIYHVFKCYLSKQPDVKLNEEHVNYKWVTIKDALKLNLILGEKESLLRIFNFQI